MDLLEDLKNCQNILYKGLNTDEFNCTSWLDNFCGEFLTFCKKLHTFLIFECTGGKGKNEIIEVTLLCLDQIISCIKYLEKTIKFEQNGKTTLPTTRQYFLDRILWCLARLKSTFSSVDDDVVTVTLDDSNFVKIMDEIMELIAPFSDYKENSNKNDTRSNNETIFIGKKLRRYVDTLLSQTLAFANVALQNDKTALSALCQKVLRECIEFQDECTLKSCSIYLSSNERNLKAVMLENALLQLEDYINESLLRLLYKVYVDYSNHSIDNIRNMIKTNPDNIELDERIADFDCNTDRILQIGMFALAFASNIQIKTKVRSVLASFESLDSSLIPSLYMNCNQHSVILEEHYHEEVNTFFKSIQEIIDTNAFCTSFIEILDETIKVIEKSFNKNLINETLNMAIMLKENFKINFKDMKIFENNDIEMKYKKFVLMLNECLAILTCANQVEQSRIIKRLKIFRSCLNNLKMSININKNEKYVRKYGVVDQQKIIERQDILLMTSGELSESNKMFESFGISPSIGSILYKSTRTRKNSTASMIGNTSKLNDSEKFLPPTPMKERRTMKRKTSMRTAMFKKQKLNESESLYKIYNEKSTSLQITEILDQLTNLSTTFSNLTQNNGCTSTQ